MKDIMNLMKQAKEMQSKMQSMQEELADITAEGEAGAGMVKVELSGKGMMQSVSIDPALFADHDAEMLEDLIVTAHNNAKAKVDAVMAEKTQELTAGLPIPPGMKLPFG